VTRRVLWCLLIHRSWEEVEGEYPWRCVKCGLRMRHAEGWELH
jgi:hypothetical protein